jgi:hypothetical protein
MAAATAEAGADPDGVLEHDVTPIATIATVVTVAAVAVANLPGMRTFMVGTVTFHFGHN